MRAVALLAVVAATLGACAPVATGTAPSATASPSPPAPEPVALEAVEAGPREDVPSALRGPDDASLPAPLVDPSRIISGGPPPDGIPALDAPLFERSESVTWLADDEPVISLTLDGERRAYPIQILHWHEIVNDTVAGRPVAVTYCPLCNSALAFDRRVGDRLLSFGTSGNLYLSALVMYDRQTESLWSQVEGRAIAGHLTGTHLELIPVSTIRWADWRAAGEGWVLSRETGHLRDYGRNPYVGYDDPDTGAAFLDQEADARLPAKERIVTFPDAREALAILTTELAAAGVAHVEVDGSPVVLFAAPGLASALDTAQVADGDPIAATAAFRPEHEGRPLTFAPVPDVDAREDGGAVAMDRETGSRWTLLGRAVAGPLDGAQLTAVPHLDTFWFAQAAFRPDTRLLRVAAR